MQARTTATDGGDAQSETKYVRTQTFEIERKAHRNDTANYTPAYTAIGRIVDHDPIDLGDMPRKGDRVEITYSYKQRGEKYGEHGEKTRAGTVTDNRPQANTATPHLYYSDDESGDQYAVSPVAISRKEKPRRRLGTPQSITVKYTESRAERRERLTEMLSGWAEKYGEHSIRGNNMRGVIEHNEGLQESEGATFVVEAELWGKETTYDFDTLPEAEDLAEHINGLDRCSATVERQEVTN